METHAYEVKYSAVPDTPKSEWEQVSYGPYTSRLEVPGGWIYRIYDGGVVFVPDPESNIGNGLL